MQSLKYHGCQLVSATPRLHYKHLCRNSMTLSFFTVVTLIARRAPYVLMSTTSSWRFLYCKAASMHSHHTAQSYTLVHFTNQQQQQRYLVCGNLYVYAHTSTVFLHLRTDGIAHITVLTVHARVDSTSLWYYMTAPCTLLHYLQYHCCTSPASSTTSSVSQAVATHGCAPAVAATTGIQNHSLTQSLQ
jgi:hypothetical protein